jgi:hypothetical protein
LWDKLEALLLRAVADLDEGAVDKDAYIFISSDPIWSDQDIGED